MKFADHLNIEQIRKFNQLRYTSRNQKEKKSKPLVKQKQERFSHRDLLILMGTRRDTYKRVNGAVRRR
ncbi:hypothetical protein [Cytobacillus oceanisediminis]|uniref:hypothetical protein n=1 Tax=Cytobacillus oceanisediminis TaxID=665099 RepID=UPI00207A9D8F|nr:hypothetical protein [Cytobacillus oceanisediminis]USK43735.1 hypothetical protein LIT27_24675 [Cytobacillus oceanisediminis]